VCDESLLYNGFLSKSYFIEVRRKQKEGGEEKRKKKEKRRL